MHVCTIYTCLQIYRCCQDYCYEHSAVLSVFRTGAAAATIFVSQHFLCADASLTLVLSARHLRYKQRLRAIVLHAQGRAWILCRGLEVQHYFQTVNMTINIIA